MAPKGKRGSAERIRDELIRFGEDCIKVMGFRLGSGYVKRCIPMWEEAFGQQIAQQITDSLRETAKKQAAKERKEAEDSARWD